MYKKLNIFDYKNSEKFKKKSNSITKKKKKKKKKKCTKIKSSLSLETLPQNCFCL